MMLTPTVDNIVRVYRSAAPSQLQEGAGWYQEAHTIALSLDPGNPRRAAGVIAALSPQMQWPRNVNLAGRAYREGEASGTLGRSVQHANAILAGVDPLDVLQGPKTRAFFALIADPDDPWTVVVDRHAVDIAVGERLETAERSRWFPLKPNGWYPIFADRYRDAAFCLNVLPSTMQAVTWVVWRDRWAGIRVAIPTPAFAG